MSERDVKKVSKDALVAAIVAATNEHEELTTDAKDDRILRSIADSAAAQQSSTARVENALLQIQQRLDGFDKKVDSLEVRMNAQDTRIAQLEAKPSASHPLVDPEELAALKDTLSHHQRFLESLDADKRRCNVILMGVGEGELVMDGSSLSDDVGKVNSILRKLEVDTPPSEIIRLGKLAPNDNTSTANQRPRPMKVTFQNERTRERLMAKTAALKGMGEPWSKVYIKRDVHPSIRKENKRLQEVVKREKEKPENRHKNVRYDRRSRTVMIDELAIDRFSPHFF